MQVMQRMPVLFVGHGSPMNAIDDNEWSRGFQKLGRMLPEPKAILSISAHWYVAGTFVTGDEHPRTIHDFGGFPAELYEQRYPAPGNVDLARRVSKLVGRGASLRTDWGLDHGTWTVLKHMRPNADVPVVQLSIDGRLPPAGHLAIGQALAPLRQEGVLILGSGHVTHNLRHAFDPLRIGPPAEPAPKRSPSGIAIRTVARATYWDYSPTPHKETACCRWFLRSKTAASSSASAASWTAKAPPRSRV